MRARLTLIAIENYLNNEEKSIGDSWELNDIESFDRETLLATIIFKAGIFEPIFTDPEYFYSACSFFWKKWSKTFTDWYNHLALEYNPIENYDRYESWSDSSSGSGTNNTTANRSVTTSDNVIRSEDSTTENSVSAFDVSSYSDHDKSVTDLDISESDSGSTTDNNLVANTTSDENESEHEGHIHGNIGVTTSQQMLLDQLDKIDTINLYDRISDIFIREMLVTVW